MNFCEPSRKVLLNSKLEAAIQHPGASTGSSNIQLMKVDVTKMCNRNLEIRDDCEKNRVVLKGGKDFQIQVEVFCADLQTTRHKRRFFQLQFIEMR